MRNFTFLLLAVIFSISVKAQLVEKKWSTRFQGDPQASLGGLTTDGSGNAYLAYTAGYVLTVVKYTAAGTRLWLTNYVGPKGSVPLAHDIQVDASGNVYIAGDQTPTNNEADFLTIKYNSAGVLQWARTFNGSLNYIDQALSLAVDASGNVYSAGTCNILLNADFCLLKYTSAGVLEWSRTYDGVDVDMGSGPRDATELARKVKLDNAGNIYIGGHGEGQLRTIYTAYDYLVIKYNTAGTQQWVARYNSPKNGYDYVEDMVVDASGRTYLTGQSNGPNGTYDVLTIRLRTTGKLDWSDFVDGNAHLSDVGHSLVLDVSGNVLVGGETGATKGLQNYLVLKYSNSGVRQWAAMYDGGGSPSIDAGMSLRTDLQGASYITGHIRPTTLGSDIVTVKFSSAGARLWDIKYTGLMSGGFDNGKKIATYQPSGPAFKPADVFIAGESERQINLFDVVLVKYEQPQVIGAAQVIDEMPAAGKFLLNNYPNPFKNSTTINYSIPEDSYVSLIVYDQLGRQVKQLVSAHQNAGIYNKIFNSENLSAGVYHYKIVANTGKKNFEQTKMMVLSSK